MPDTATEHVQQNLESLTVAEACLQARGGTPLEADDKTALSEVYDWISSFILSGDEFGSRSEHEQGRIPCISWTCLI